MDGLEFFRILVSACDALETFLHTPLTITRWSESWAVSTWSIGSAFIALGASVRDALLVVLFADIFSAAVIIFNGRAAARYHVGYPVLARVSFGIYGSYFFVVLRALLGIIWGMFTCDLSRLILMIY
jgi:cytosine/uracil/thiamine/allantoin permease